MKLFNFLELFIKFAIKIFGGYLLKAYATIFRLIPASSILSPTVVTTSISTDVITMTNMAHYHQIQQPPQLPKPKPKFFKTMLLSPHSSLPNHQNCSH